MGPVLNSLVLYITVLLLKIVNADRPIITTELGQLEGVWQTSAKGLKYAAFLGIPYAKPPIDDLRFEPPEKIEPWTGVLDAGAYRSFCMAYEHLTAPTDRIAGEEDCLYLNIFSPQIPQEGGKDKKPLDVIFYIHGGVFMFGRSDQYGAKYIMDRDVIFVTFNYRLGPLGFLSFEDEIMPGNNGLRDQRMALKWINKHISKFGGDPKSVTLMGHCAGGASVHYHLLSQNGKELYRNAISMSGTATSPWALVDKPRERATKLATTVGCTFDNGTQNVVNCLKDRPAGDILQAVGQFYDSPFSPLTAFGPVIEHTPSLKYPPIVHKAPLKSMKCGKQRRVPWMVGIMGAEGLYPVASFITKEDLMEELDENFNALAPQLLDLYDTVNITDMLRVTKKIRKEYFHYKEISNKTAKHLIRMVSDRLFVLDAQNAAKIQGEFSPVYFYKLSRRPTVSYSDVLAGTEVNFGASHLDDHAYLMNTTIIPEFIRTETEKEFMEMMLDLWTSFATSSRSSLKSKGVCWKWLQPWYFNYLNLDEQIPAKMDIDNDMGNVDFWTSLPINESTQRTYRLKKLRFFQREKEQP